MNSIHDLGGMDGLGPIDPETDEPVFHAEWERRVFALTVAMGFYGAWNIDTSRHARERTPAAEYLSSSYYEIWLSGLRRLLDETGLLTQAGQAPKPTLTAQSTPAILRKGGSARVAAEVPAIFAPGDRVVVRNLNPTGHTRAPRYVRCKTGTIERDYGVFIFPDTHAHGKGPQPQHVYSVRFAAREVWGDDASPNDAIYIDLWDSYLDQA